MVSRHTRINPSKAQVRQDIATKWIKQGVSKKVRMMFLVALLSSSKMKVSLNGT